MSFNWSAVISSTWARIRYFDWASIRSFNWRSPRNIALVATAALLLCLGTCALVRCGGPEDTTGLSARIYFKCEECGARFYLTAEEIDDRYRTRSSGRTMTGPFRVRCKECGKLTGVRDRAGASGS